MDNRQDSTTTATGGIGERIRTRRKESRMALRELGRRCDLTAGFLCDLERGRRGVSVDAAVRIASALGVSPAWLIGESAEVKLTKTAQVRMCGNSVSPPPAEALVRANFTDRAREVAA